MNRPVSEPGLQLKFKSTTLASWTTSTPYFRAIIMSPRQALVMSPDGLFRERASAGVHVARWWETLSVSAIVKGGVNPRRLQTDLEDAISNSRGRVQSIVKVPQLHDSCFVAEPT